MSIPLVSVICTAYNHEPYIRQCLDGFVMQKTNFKIEVLISDDASTDNTAQIIKEYEQRYPDLFVTFYHKENLYSQHINFFIKELIANAKGKYIALCEGDDYWTDPLKLQKQVDVLEENKDCNACFHAFSYYWQNENRFERDKQPSLLKERSNGFKFTNDDRAKEWFTCTLTLMFRRDKYPSEEIMSSYTEFVDIHVFYYLLKDSKGYYLKDDMAVYRKNNGGIWTGLNREKQLKINELWCGELYKHEKNKYTKSIIQGHIFQQLQCDELRRKFSKFVKDFFKLGNKYGFSKCFIGIWRIVLNRIKR